MSYLPVGGVGFVDDWQFVLSVDPERDTRRTMRTEGTESEHEPSGRVCRNPRIRNKEI